jgi:hypothetical protein
LHQAWRGGGVSLVPRFRDGETHLPLPLLRSVIPGRIWWPVGAVVLQGLINRRLDPSLKFPAWGSFCGGVRAVRVVRDRHQRR